MSEAAERLGSIDLAGWFDRHGRSLPWRESRDPWAVLVAEMMLQQTQVARVVDRWHRFLDRFPTAAACAEAPVADVIDEWAGLGYNRRAVHLHEAAQMVVRLHDGGFPDDRAGLVALPGVGPYTARAVRVFAFEQREAVLDTNVGRILARVAGRQLEPAEAQAMADASVGPDPWRWNQALLDVGATMCVARETECRPCPLRSACAWFQAGNAEPDPARGSAGVSKRQSRFAGSDREGRGRLVKALRIGPVKRAELPYRMGFSDEPERAERVAAGVVADGLAVETEGVYRLPR